MSLMLSSPARINRKSRATRLGEEMAAAIDTRLAGKSATTDKAMFVGYNTSTFASTRNATCWCADVQGITAISAWNSEDKNFHGGTLIAPDVIVYADHSNTEFADGTVFSFVTLEGNTVVTRTQTSSVMLGTDIRVAKLDSEVPETISFAKVLSQSDYLAFQTYVASNRVPILITDQEEKALVMDTSALGSYDSTRVPVDSKRLEFYEALVGGDSGNAFLLIHGTDVVILAPVYSYFGGYSVHHHRNEINAAMTALGSVHQLTELEF